MIWITPPGRRRLFLAGMAYDTATTHIQDLAGLVAKYDGRAPRYTSYPTALQFTPAIDAELYRDWLAQLPATVGDNPAWAASISGVLLLAALRR